MTTRLLEFTDISLQYDNKKVVNNINFNINKQEIVALVGKSGSGKSTLLKMICQIIMPTSGKINYCNNITSDKIAMVFQNFALFPWLTVAENIAVVLEEKGLSKQQIERKVAAQIELIGLEGHQNAYPKELSGGMKQRVGIARALAVEPEIMLMDEPFSALDVLTANILKADLIDLWCDNKIPLKSILIVTHNIEEAVMIADKVIVLASNPGTIAAQITIDSTRPRSPQDQNYANYVSTIYSYFTSPK
jgi:NitT/TauT family transport system ATP-binding protein